MAYQLNGNPINIDAPYVAADGTKYANLRDPMVRALLNIYEVADAPAYDQRFYWSPDNPKLLDDRPEFKEDGTPLYVQVYDPVTESMVDTAEQVVTKGLKSQWIAQAKDTAGKMLAATDWKVVRAAEGVKPADQVTLDYRAAIRAYSDSIETAIKGCTSVEQLIDVINNQNWPKEV